MPATFPTFKQNYKRSKPFEVLARIVRLLGWRYGNFTSSLLNDFTCFILTFFSFVPPVLCVTFARSSYANLIIYKRIELKLYISFFLLSYLLLHSLAFVLSCKSDSLFFLSFAASLHESKFRVCAAILCDSSCAVTAAIWVDPQKIFPFPLKIYLIWRLRALVAINSSSLVLPTTARSKQACIQILHGEERERAGT